jgi:hypothetical protein
MIGLPSGTKLFLACQPIDLRAGFDGLAAKVQQTIGARSGFGDRGVACVSVSSSTTIGAQGRQYQAGTTLLPQLLRSGNECCPSARRGNGFIHRTAFNERSP